MESSVHTETILKLNEEERIWLMQAMQNPIKADVNLGDEDIEDKRMRTKFWCALTIIKEENTNAK